MGSWGWFHDSVRVEPGHLVVAGADCPQYLPAQADGNTAGVYRATSQLLVEASGASLSHLPHFDRLRTIDEAAGSN